MSIVIVFLSIVIITNNHTINWLVVWLPVFIFPSIGNVIIPIDFHSFQRGGPTTNQIHVISSTTLLQEQICVKSVKGGLEGDLRHHRQAGGVRDRNRWPQHNRWGRHSHGGFYSHGGTLIAGLYGKSQSKVDDDWRYPH